MHLEYYTNGYTTKYVLDFMFNRYTNLVDLSLNIKTPALGFLSNFRAIL